MSEPPILDASTIRALEEVKREQSKPDLEGTFFKIVWTLGLLGAGWVATKMGLAIHDVSKLVADPAAAAADAARGIRIKQVRNQIAEASTVPDEELRRQARSTNPNIAARAKKILSDRAGTVQDLESELSSLLVEEEREMVREEEEEGIVGYKLLKQVDGFYGRWGSIAPVAVVGTFTSLELLRVRRLRKA